MAYTFTTKHQVDTLVATLEANTQIEEQNEFGNYNSITNDLLDHTDAGSVYDKVLVLNGGYNGQIGLTKSFSVVPGDKVKASVYAKYIDITGDPGNLANLATVLPAAFGLTPGMPGETGTAYNALESFGAFIAAGERVDDENDPKGFLNILVFNKDFDLVDLAYEQIDAAYVQSGSTKMPHQLLSKEVEIRQPGYVYVFLSNEEPSELQIGFDDYEVIHEHSDVIQASDFMPFGLSFNDYQKEGSLKQRWKFQKQEHIDDLDLGWVQFKWRNHMPDIGRFFNVDPLAQKYVHNSTYAFSENKVTAHVELEGLESVSYLIKKEGQYAEKKVEGALKGIGDGVRAVGGFFASTWNSFGDWIESLPKETDSDQTRDDTNVVIYSDDSPGDDSGLPKPGEDSKTLYIEKEIIDAVSSIGASPGPEPDNAAEVVKNLGQKSDEQVTVPGAVTKKGHTTKGHTQINDSVRVDRVWVSNGDGTYTRTSVDTVRTTKDEK